MAINRIVARWQGFVGGPGYSNFYFTELPSDESVLSARQRVSAFFVELQPILPTSVTVAIENEVAIIDEATGQTTGYANPTAGVVGPQGGGSGGYSGATGAVVNWNTNGVRSGRRVRGRTFLVPLAGSAYDTEGSLTTAALSRLRDAADEMIGTGFDSGFGVWARPTNGADGAFYEVTSATVPDLAAVLRSRRD